MKYTVRYKVKGFDKEFETPEYDSLEFANFHRDDIKGYDGVYESYVYLVPHVEIPHD
jgi:hypothetical protein